MDNSRRNCVVLACEYYGDIKMIELIIPDTFNNLRREVYRFYVENEYHIWLDEYAIQTRITTRHKWQSIKQYSRLINRDIYGDKILHEQDVPLHDGIIRTVKDKLVEELQVKKWSER